MVRGDRNMQLTKTEGNYSHQVNGKTSSFPEESTLTPLPIQQPIQWDFSSKVNRWYVTLTTHRHLVLWLQMSGAVPPLPYMPLCTGTTLPFSWSWHILSRNPPARCQENCISIVIFLHMIHKALSMQHIVRDHNFTCSGNGLSNFSAVCRSMHSCHWLWNGHPPTYITRHYNHSSSLLRALLCMCWHQIYQNTSTKNTCQKLTTTSPNKWQETEYWFHITQATYSEL